MHLVKFQFNNHVSISEVNIFPHKLMLCAFLR